MRLRLSTIRCLAVFLPLLFAACSPPDIDLSGDEAEADNPLSDQPGAVTPRTPGSGAIEHTLRFSEPHTHYIEVESIFPTDGDDELTLFMAVWTPGSYLVREFAGHVETWSATTLAGDPLLSEKSRKNRWTIATGGADRVVVRYRIYARILSVQGNFVDDDLVVLNGAGVFLCPVDRLGLEHDVALELDETAYPEIATSLPPHTSGGRRFVASSYDVLVDSPIVAGTGEVRSFDVGGATFELWTFGGDELWDHDRAARDVQKIVEAQTGFWGVVPFERYLFLNVAENRGGGLEHLESTLLMTRRFVMRRDESYRSWLGLVSHELFHAWNAKRLRPDVLGPFDYENEVRTPSLWIVEGFTSYYDDVLLRRAGLLTDEQYLERLGSGISQLMLTPGRDVMSLAESSNESWIKYYRRDENSDNATISYYNKGSLVAFLLDTYLRRKTSGAASLDDVMRLMYERHAGERGYTPDDFRVALETVAGELPPETLEEGESPDGEVDALLDAWVEGVEPLPLEEALFYYGLVFEGEVDEEEEASSAEDEEEDETPGWLAMDTDGGWVTALRRGGPAQRAGLIYDDEILAIDGYRTRNLGSRLERYRPGDIVTFTVSRRGRLREIQVTLGRAPADDAWSLTDAETMTTAERTRRQRWLEDLRAAPESGSGAAPTSDEPAGEEQDGDGADHEG